MNWYQTNVWKPNQQPVRGHFSCDSYMCFTLVSGKKNQQPRAVSSNTWHFFNPIFSLEKFPFIKSEVLKRVNLALQQAFVCFSGKYHCILFIPVLWWAHQEQFLAELCCSYRWGQQETRQRAKTESRGAEITAKAAEGDLLHKGRKKKRSALHPKMPCKPAGLDTSPQLTWALTDHERLLLRCLVLSHNFAS